MKTVYRASNITEADIVAGLLQSRDIEAKVAGRHLQTVVGAAAIPYSSRIVVNEQQYEEALAIVKEYENNHPVSELEQQKRKPFPAMGMFTNPVLFWITVFLLLFWFFFSGVPTGTSGQVGMIIWDEGMEEPLGGVEALEDELGGSKGQ